MFVWLGSSPTGIVIHRDDTQSEDRKSCSSQSDIEEGNTKTEIEDSEYKDDAKHDTNSEIDDDIEEVVEESKSKEVCLIM